MNLIAKSSEYSTDNFEITKIDGSPWTEKELAKFSQKPNKDLLGLYFNFDSSRIIRPNYYIGYCWLNQEKEEYISISPKNTMVNKLVI